MIYIKKDYKEINMLILIFLFNNNKKGIYLLQINVFDFK